MNVIKMAGVVAVIISILAYGQEQEPPLPPPLNLPLLAPEAVPDGGNFYSAAHSEGDEAWPPLPFNPLATNLNVPVYSLAQAFGKPFGAPFYLIDDRAWYQAKVQAEQEQLAMQMLEAAARGEKLDKFGRKEAPAPTILARGLAPMTNDLQLDIEDVTNGVVSLTVLNPTSMTNNPV